MLHTLKNKLLFRYKQIKQSVASINWNINWATEKAIIADLKIKRSQYPKSGIYDTLFQYKAQTYNSNLGERFLINLISFFGCIFIITRSIIARTDFKSNMDVAYFYSLSIFSESIKKDKKLIFIDQECNSLVLRDLAFLFKVFFKTGFNFAILSTVSFRIAQIRWAMNTYEVKEIWTNMEYSCACGVVYEYCKLNNIKFNNFMHGEKLLTSRDSFCVFDNFYVWDTHYKKMFEQLSCRSDFIIENPWQIDIGRRNFIEKSICYFFKGIETNAEIQKLKTLFGTLQNKGYQIFLKNHPRQHQSSNFFLEYPVIDNSLKTEDIFETYEYIMAQYSTVLLQAYYRSIPVIIDDLSNTELSSRLLDRNWYFTKVEVNEAFLLSKLI